ncbi:lasso peptide biosynthesis PqqD family chaperone [Paenibacillus sp. JX-17]|uniref:Lasso peptide biosynthesis PqqD family chaperone n=1 Tax=Paenibacillus lacisoli TaxID=3064525 RepID=A0ABT9CDA9_9BACL|nr:lasso peptide biosynthesis PqqD family chaperone [Paenibacillus sp. JX-17]MDO7907222.1 lasso peptide biosynthesis PqqD family chaperone [Paenibacillus sp. JX-17]
MKTEQLRADEIISQKPGTLVSDMDGEKVMLSIDTGKYYNLGQTGGRIWELLETPKTISQMTEILCAEYEIEADKCMEQIRAFVTKLSGEGLIIIGK